VNIIDIYLTSCTKELMNIEKVSHYPINKRNSEENEQQRPVYKLCTQFVCFSVLLFSVLPRDDKLKFCILRQLRGEIQI